MGQETPSPHPSRVLLNPGKVGHQELSTLAQGGTARSDSPPPQDDINLKPLNFATMQIHILKHTEQETRLDMYNEIRGILNKTTPNWSETPNNSSLGICTYWRCATLSHLPRVLITESSIPLAAAVVAVPMQKLWLQYFCWSTLAELRAVWTTSTKRPLVRNCPSSNKNRGPGCEPRTVKYPSSTATVHKSKTVLPTNRSTPCQNGVGFRLLDLYF